MMIVLIILNIILILIIFILFFIKKSNNNMFYSNIENIDLIEFQKGLKELIEELKKISDTSIKNFEVKKKEIDENIILIDSKIKELKYLIERNQIVRQTEYKKEINKIEIKQEKDDNIEFKNKLLNKKIDSKDMQNIKNKENNIKILIEDNKKDGLDNQSLKYSQIYNLIKNGVSVEEISKITGMTKGEIELIKNIKK
jgi:hypothetical protein